MQSNNCVMLFAAKSVRIAKVINTKFGVTKAYFKEVTEKKIVVIQKKNSGKITISVVNK